MEWLKAFFSLTGRILLVLIFLNSGIGKIGNFEGTAQYMAKFGMSNTSFFLFGAIVFELVGSVTVILGYFTRLGALLILIFLIPTTLIFHSTSASFMPGILGGMIAWNSDEKFLPGYFLLVILGLVLNHMALNMTDDYYDFRHLVDVFATDGKNPYTGGSGLLSSGLIQPRRMSDVFIIFYIIAIGIGGFLGNPSLGNHALFHDND